MSSSQTYQAGSKKVCDDAGGLLPEQTTPHLPQNSISSLAFTSQSLDGDSKAKKLTDLQPGQEQVATATMNTHPVGPICELMQGPIVTENTKEPGLPFVSENNMPNLRFRKDSPKVLDVERTIQTASGPLRSSIAVASFQLHYPNETARASLKPENRLLSQQLEMNCGDDACLATVAAACMDFQERMMRMPPEICQMIMDIVFDEAFGPRRVHPHKDPPIMNIFLALNKQFYRKLRAQYWTKNTWVISKGPLNKTMRFMTEKPYNETTTEFSLQIPNKAALQIRFVELSFSNADTPDLPEWQQLAEQSAAPCRIPSPIGPITSNAPAETQSLQVAERGTDRAQRYDDIQYQLIQTWQDKFDRVAMLNLRHLTLDFTEAYEPSGLHLGVYLVRRLIPFAYGIPADFKILAPDHWIETQIRDAFCVLNAD